MIKDHDDNVDHAIKDLDENIIFCGPETVPIDTLEELLRVGSDGFVQNSKSQCYRIPNLRQRSNTNGPLTLFCHDMKGGYLEDRFNDGHPNIDAYRFCYWPFIDIFCYFSHHFVTIPPLGWVCASHRNGVRCFGTIIIEHWTTYTDSSSDILQPNKSISGKQLISEMLRDETRVDQVTSALTNIAVRQYIDGWLVNIETPISTEQIELMEMFIRRLTQKMKQIRSNRNDIDENNICVLWYDSVTGDNGLLKWQNELNKHNVRFFDACDGIFLNYCWTAENLARSREMALQSKRKNRIFVGLDVFGRGCLGGGGLSSDVAIAEIRKADLSVALFAPAWTFEVYSCNKFVPTNERLFWSKLVCYLAERTTSELPICSWFCQGFGDRLYANGTVISTESWFDLRRQQFQPRCLCSNDAISLSTEDAFNGGSCLRLFANNNPIELFRFHITIVSKRSLTVSIVYKCLSFEIVSSDNLPNLVTLLNFRQISTDSVTIESIKFDIHQCRNTIPYAVNSIESERNELANGWRKDWFRVELNSDKPWPVNELVLSSIAIALSPLHIDSDKSKEFLIGQMSIE